MVNDMLEQGVIQESCSPWNSPLFLVPKKGGTFRPVIDFRNFNAVALNEHYPLPVVRDLFMFLGRGNKILSSLDLLSDYWEGKLEPASRDTTTFNTPSGHYEWLRMPFDLKSAPLMSQRTINNLFACMLGNSVFAYLDDLIIASKDPETRLKNLTSGSSEDTGGWPQSKTKCEFLNAEIKFLGMK